MGLIKKQYLTYNCVSVELVKLLMVNVLSISYLTMFVYSQLHEQMGETITLLIVNTARLRSSKQAAA